MTDPVSRSARTLGLFAVVGSVMCFAISFGLIKWPGTDGSVIAWWRLVGSSLLWWVGLITLRVTQRRPLPSRDAWRQSMPAALVFGLLISTLFTAVTRTSVAHAEFIASLAPLLTIPAGFVFFHERPQWTALRWGALSVVGIVIVLFFGPDQGVATLGGDLLMILVLLFSVSYLLTAKRARSRGVTTFDFMAILMPVALVSATPVALVVAGDQLWPLSGRAWIAVGLLSVLTGGLAHGLQFFAHRSVPLGTISTVVVSQPAMSVFWAWVIVGEEITRVQVPGMALVIVGMSLVVWFSQRPDPTRGPAAGAAIPATRGRPAH
ncbi:MAG: DMT family transporter [Ilumatobacter sp.]|uniref:DMT family transporter n=1 Tax=Ilumatobacter sp. TaxID=1967498 RepID=UPI00262AA456|nr:DMT family transporter [Ilumatobacter sp.]MDJ0767665.1 DMT family transporter [Ilumatobacter sp.]